MCERRPCWPTPDEAKRIKDAGFGDRLMIDYWVESPTDIKIECPAIVGYEGLNAPFIPVGRCTFLKDGLCELHDLGLKPLEGRVASCQGTVEDSQAVRDFIVSEWRNNQEQFNIC